MGPKPAAGNDKLPKVAAKSAAKIAPAGGGGASSSGKAAAKLPAIASPQKPSDTDAATAVATPAAATEVAATEAPPASDPAPAAPAASSAPAQPAAPTKPVSSKPDGNVTLIYEQYNEQFPIVGGSTTHAAVDDVYCLSFVMEGCLIHLSAHDPSARRDKEIAGLPFRDIYVYEEPVGTYWGLEADATYYVYVEQQADALKRDQEETAKRLAGAAESVVKDAYGNVLDAKGRVLESCSCKYGNPCTDAMYCEDWDNRFAVAKKNGWKEF
jgi:hypothetical protein